MATQHDLRGWLCGARTLRPCLAACLLAACLLAALAALLVAPPLAGRRASDPPPAAAGRALAEQAGDERRTTTWQTRGYAVCVVGAVRSMAEPYIVSNFESNVLRPVRDSAEGGDIFYYLFVGREVSKRGQEPVTAKEASAMAAAMRGATEFQFQYEENDFRCGQMSTGKFYKAAQCARMVINYEKAHKLSYLVFIITRPDAFYRSPMPANLATLIGGQRLALVIVSVGDTDAMSRDALGLIAGLDNVTCCDVERRWPPGCFHKGLAEPDVNNIFMMHMMSHGCRKWGTPWRATIKRAINFGKMNPGFKPMAYHGKFRSEVSRSATPRTSGVIAWDGNDPVGLITSLLPGE